MKQEIIKHKSRRLGFFISQMEGQEKEKDACCNQMIPMKWNLSWFVLFPL